MKTHVESAGKALVKSPAHIVEQLKTHSKALRAEKLEKEIGRTETYAKYAVALREHTVTFYRTLSCYLAIIGCGTAGYFGWSCCLGSILLLGA